MTEVKAVDSLKGFRKETRLFWVRDSGSWMATHGSPTQKNEKSYWLFLRRLSVVI